jgi:uncharacterized cofD-like protein
MHWNRKGEVKPGGYVTIRRMAWENPFAPEERERTEGKPPPSFVVLGGGAGPSLVAKALSDHLEGLVAVVCTTDTGSSTGTCRRLFNIPAPGDLRATLSTFATLSGNSAWARLWEERLQCPDSHDLHGMALGNLFIAAFFQRTGDFAKAVMLAGEMLGLKGKVLPVTVDFAQLEAELLDGTIVSGELEVRRTGKAEIRQLRWHGGIPRPTPGVLEAVKEADLILIGPGCLYTSVLPCLLVEGMADAILGRKGRSVYLCNTTTTPGQTDGFTVARHVEVVVRALGPGGIDAVLVNNGTIPSELAKGHGSFGVVPIIPSAEDMHIIASLGLRAFLSHLTEDLTGPMRKLHKMDTVRHDPVKLRWSLEKVCQELGPG